jgi:site-specific DNA-methyltransferase (adenine-specific)
MSDIKLIHGDCLEKMGYIPDKSIDMILTDPPYLHIKGGNKRLFGGKYTFKGKERFNDTYINTNMSDFGEREIFYFLDVANTKLKKTNLILFCSELQLQYYFKWIYENKKKYNLLIWDKGKRCIMNRNRYMSNIEYIIRIYENKVSLNSIEQNELYCKTKTNKEDKEKFHITQKPIKLLEGFILLHSKEKDTILDPFMGSGSTGVACLNTNRNFIGIEKDNKYFEIAKKRIQEAQLVLF